MARRTVTISDLSGKDIEAGDEVQIRVISYPQLSEPVQIDASVAEADRLKLENKPLALLEIVTQDGTEQVAVDAEVLAKTVKGDIYEILSQAARVVLVQAPASEPARQRRPRGSGEPKPEKTDYTSVEFAGRVKRGLVSEGEKETVRTHFDEVQENLAAAGQRTLDLHDIAVVEKYGLQELAKERGIEPAAK